MNYEKMSVDELEKLIIQKNGDAICEMAYRCRTGINGVEINLTRAYQLYHKGEKQGLAEAYYGLHEMYKNGEGVTQSDELAEKYRALLPEGFTSKYVNRLKQEPIPVPKPEPTPISGSKPSNEKINLDNLKEILEEGENYRANNNYLMANEQAKNTLAQISKVRGGTQTVGSGDIDVLEVEAYWLLAYTAFNEQKYREMDSYMSKPGVIALHPWGTYLCSIVHQSNNAPSSVLEADMQKMINVQDNCNLSQDQRGDILAQIGDFYLSGLGENGQDIEQAYAYFEQAADCGNAFAIEQAGRFKKTISGKIKLIG